MPRKRLTEERLAASIREAVSDVRLRENARRLAQELRKEDGVGAAVDVILGTTRR